MGFCQALFPAGLLPWPLAAPNQHSESDRCAGCLQASAGIFCPDLLVGAFSQLAEEKKVIQVSWRLSESQKETAPTPAVSSFSFRCRLPKPTAMVPLCWEGCVLYPVPGVGPY